MPKKRLCGMYLKGGVHKAFSPIFGPTTMPWRCHYPGDMAVRMRKVLARARVGVRVYHLLLLYFTNNSIYCYAILLKENKRYCLHTSQLWPIRPKLIPVSVT